MKKSRAAKNSAAAHRMRFGKDPYFDWTVILALFIAIAVLCVSFAFALWHIVSAGPLNSSDVSSAASTVSEPSLDTANLQKVITVQSEKSSAALQYEHGYPGPADPSL